MKKLLTVISLCTLPLTGMAASETYIIDSSHTYPNFTISHLGFSTMHGRFNSSKGKITMDKAAKTGSVNITIDASSIDTGFAKRDKHLRSPDFLNVGEFPEITFKSSKVSLGDNSGSITGKLTIMGVSKSITLNITHIKCGIHPFNKKSVCGFDANGSIKRSDFGVKYGIPAIGDEMKLAFEVEAVKK